MEYLEGKARSQIERGALFLFGVTGVPFPLNLTCKSSVDPHNHQFLIFPWPSIHQVSSHQYLAGLDTQGSQEILGHVSGLMSSAHARRPFAPSTSLDSIRQHKDRQRKMSNYFAAGLPYSRYYLPVISISSCFDTDLWHGNGVNRKLIGHSSCVNALAFSSGEGRWLASAGDGESLLPCWVTGISGAF
jgi:hypothetical protein